MKGFGSVIVALTLFFLIVHVQAGSLSMESYLKTKDKGDSVMYLQGYLDAFEVANGSLNLSKRPQVYCAPAKLGLNASKLKQIVDDYYGQNMEIFQKGTPFAVVALFALQEAFPCKP